MSDLATKPKASKSAATGTLTKVLMQLSPWQTRAGLLSVAAVLTATLVAAFPKALTAVEEQLGSLGWLWSPATQPEERINIIAIDEKSLEEVGSWPWPRSTMAQLSSRLADAGVQLQLYDIHFPEAKDGDEFFVGALQNSRAVIAQVPDLLNPDQLSQTGQLTHPLVAVGAGVSCKNAANTNNFVANAAAFSAIPKGHITALVDSDGAVRKVPAYICVQDQAYPALAISALLTTAGRADWKASVSQGQGWLAPAQALSFESYPGLSIPLDKAANLRVSFKNAPEVYRAFSASDILNGRIDSAMLENTWALVGFTAAGLNDVVSTPYQGATHGVELQARILGSVLDGSVPYTPRSSAWLLVLLSAVFAAVLCGLVQAREKFASYGLASAALLLPLAALMLHVQLLSSANLWLGWLSPALFSFFAASFFLMHEYARVRAERTRVFSNLSSYLPTDVAEEIAYSLPNSSIVAQRKDATLLSADLRNFSAYGESRPPEESAAILHFFFTKSTEIVEQFHGRVHEFKGDSLLAVWDGSDTAAATAAMQAAIALQKAMNEALPQQPPAGLEPLALGIGIEQGPVLIGSIGAAHRRSHTLLGETVTITLRIQEMTAELAHPVLVGECAARQLAEHGLISQGSYLLAGLRNPHILYALPYGALALVTTRTDIPTLKVLRGGRS
jgi:adenylate cyclase